MCMMEKWILKQMFSPTFVPSQLSQLNSTSSIRSSWSWCGNSSWSKSSSNSKPTAPPLPSAHRSATLHTPQSDAHTHLSLTLDQQPCTHTSVWRSSTALPLFIPLHLSLTLWNWLFWTIVLCRQGLANTLDQASAQLAASAVVTADQLLALKTKEELALGGGVNGILSPSGMTPHPTPNHLSSSLRSQGWLTPWIFTTMGAFTTCSVRLLSVYQDLDVVNAGCSYKPKLTNCEHVQFVLR